MISLISPALIIPFSPPLPVLESVSQPRELTVQASVDEQTADLGHESAQELAVGDLFEHHLLAAEDAPETTGQRRPLGLAERHRGADTRAHAAGRLVLELAVRGGDHLQMVD